MVSLTEPFTTYHNLNREYASNWAQSKRYGLVLRKISDIALTSLLATKNRVHETTLAQQLLIRIGWIWPGVRKGPKKLCLAQAKQIPLDQYQDFLFQGLVSKQLCFSVCLASLLLLGKSPSVFLDLYCSGNTTSFSNLSTIITHYQPLSPLITIVNHCQPLST